MSPVPTRNSAFRDRRDRFGLLLVATLGAFAVQGIATPRVWDQVVVTLLLSGILIGLFFAQLYGAIDRAGGGHFFANGLKATPSDCVYFSFTTLSTIGYGDITASGNFGHTLSVTKGLIGQIYLVTIVSLFVGNLGRSRVER
jgi:hypothetical protein